MATKTTINITSDDRLWTPDAAGATSLTQPLALAELIANSIDWSLLSQVEAQALIDDAKAKKPGAEDFLKRLQDEYGKDLKKITSKKSDPTANVSIVVMGKSYIIADDGVGMNSDELENALILRGASNETRPNLRPRKGKFGMGMKSGILTLGWNITIWTRSIKTPGKEIRINIDTRKIDDRSLTLDSIPISTHNSGDDKNSPLTKFGYEHGTAIQISDLVSSVGGPAFYWKKLGLSFTPDIRSKVAIINVIDAKTEPKKSRHLGCCPIPTDTYDTSFKEVKIEDKKIFITPDEGGDPVLLTGWLRMLTKGRPGGERLFGFNLFRQGQLIESYHNTGGKTASSGLWPIRLHTNHAKLIGELNLDMCSPNYTKAGWNTNSAAWKEVKTKLEAELRKAIAIAAKPATKVKTVGNLKAWEALFSATATTVAAVAASTGSSTSGSSSGTTSTTDKSAFSEKTITLKDGTAITIASVQEAKLSTEEPWQYYWEPKSSELVITYNTESVLYKQYAEIFNTGFAAKSEQSKMLSAWAVFDSLFLVLTDTTGPFNIPIIEAMEYRTKWLTAVFSTSGTIKVSPPKISSQPISSKGAKTITSGKTAFSDAPVFPAGELSSRAQIALKIIQTKCPDEPIKESLKRTGIEKESLEFCTEQEINTLMKYYRSYGA